MTSRSMLLLAASLFATTLAAQAAEPASCRNARFADVGWTDITVTTALTSKVLQALGYTTKTNPISVPVTCKSLENKDIDVLLGNWMPAMESALMDAVLNGNKKPEQAATAWIKANPKVVDSWLGGVTTFDGKPVSAAVKAAMARQARPDRQGMPWSCRRRFVCRGGACSCRIVGPLQFCAWTYPEFRQARSLPGSSTG